MSGISRLYSDNNFRGAHNLEVNVGGEFRHSMQSLAEVEGVIDNFQVNSSHRRIAIDGSYEHNLASGGMLNPSISVGIRADGRNDNSHFGLDVGSEIRFLTFNGLEVSGAGKSMLAGFNQTNSWQVEISLDFDSDSDGKGLLFSLSPAWSGTESDSGRFIWGSELVNSSDEPYVSSDGGRISADIGYGYDVLDESAVITPYSAFHQAIAHGSEIRVGSRIATIKGLNFELEIGMDIPETGILGHELNLAGNFRW